MKLFPWLDKTYQNIIRIYSDGKKPHSLLFHSNDGNGELVLLQTISWWLMCKKKSNIYPCEKCLSCTLMINNQNPDYFNFSKKEYPNFIGIEIIRSLLEKLHKYSYLGGAKVVCFPYSELLTEESVNALLKIIEEPPLNTFFIFRCPTFIQMLPTLYSRCIYFKLLTPKKEFSINWLQSKTNYNLIKINSALYLSNNSPLKALSLLNYESDNIRCLLFEIIEKSLIDRSFLNIFPLFKKNNLTILWFISLITDVIKYKQGAEKFILNNDKMKLIKKISLDWDIISLHKHFQKWLKFYENCIFFKKVDSELFIIHQLLDWINR